VFKEFISGIKISKNNFKVYRILINTSSTRSMGKRRNEERLGPISYNMKNKKPNYRDST
jgi:hypothetical protein